MVCIFLLIGTIPNIINSFEGDILNAKDANRTNYKLSVSSSTGNDGIPICSANGYQSSSQIINDGIGGYIIAWQDERNDDSDIYCQRVNSEGRINWSANEIPICAISEEQSHPKIVSDGAGGAIVAWLDNRSSNGLDIYTQRINPSGAIQWQENGILISNMTINQWRYDIISDGNGGAIVVWEASMPGYNIDIYGQRITSDGHLNWSTDGVPICNHEQIQLYFQLASDDLGGAIIVWEDRRFSGDGVYAQRVNLTGHALWSPNGTAICSLMDEDGEKPHIINDGSGMGSVMVSWSDRRNGDNVDSFAQKLNSSGHWQWIPEGVPICVVPYNWITESPLVGDGCGGAIIVWPDRRNQEDQHDIYAQRIDTDGTINWTENGVPICTALGVQSGIALASDGSRGAIITWVDDRPDVEMDIYAQKINFTGHAKWVPNGTSICSAYDWQYSPQLVCDGNGGAVISWTDSRNYGNNLNDIYAQRINSEGYPQWSESFGSPGFFGLDLGSIALITVIAVLSVSVLLVRRRYLKKQ
ncbi:MAG: hypothetical protein ACFE8P_02460 [Promethearchaeota archaeon]